MYRVIFLDKVTKETIQLAYCVDLEKFNVYISRSGHSKMLRLLDVHWNGYFGGWIFLRQAKITFSSGTLGEVPNDDKHAIKNVISNALKIDLRITG